MDSHGPRVPPWREPACSRPCLIPLTWLVGPGGEWGVVVGAATARLIELAERLSRTRGLDSTGIVLRSVDSYLARAGMAHVERRTVPLPVGEWGGRTGSLMATDERAVFLRLAPVFEARFGIPECECRELVTAAQQEWEELHTTYGVAIALGRKPG